MFDLEDVEYPDPNIATLAMNFRTVVWYLKNFPYVLEAILSSRVLDEDFDLSTLCPNPHSCDQFPCENLCCVAREIIRQDSGFWKDRIAPRIAYMLYGAICFKGGNLLYFVKYKDKNMEPLASKIRPRNLKEFIGQDHLVGEGKPLRVAIENGHLFSFILWGPPGVGKTTLAKIYAKSLNVNLFELSAVSAGKDDIRKIVNEGNLINKILFLDEIHRFNKAQQDFLLPYVESGELVLIGATTENPSFEVISPLLSRCRVFVLNEFSEHEMRKIIKRIKIKMDKKSIDWLVMMANGDARQAITMMENCLMLYKEINIENLKNTLQSKFLRYDKKSDEHYNLISAYIKSLRAGQVDASLYYLARLVEGGEDPKFIARRMVVFASEDIGVAVPTALVVANEVFRAVETIGFPEAQINLAHGTVYLANCKKDRSAYNAYFKAMEDVKEHGNLPIPLKIRNADTKLMKDLNYGKGYEKYDKESYLPDKIKNKKYFKN